MIKETISWNYLVSVIILTWNSEEYVDKCIKSVLEDAILSKIKIEIIVIDNGSSDKTLEILEILKKEYQDLKVIKLERNYGTTVSRNIGIRKSKGKYIFILDSDTLILKNVLSTLIETIEQAKRVGIAAPRLIYPDGNIQKSCKRFPTAKIKIFKYLPFKKLRNIAEKEEVYSKEVYQPNFREIIEVDLCCSAAWMLNREAINEIGLFDENIFYSPEDVDYCLRMWLNNWKVVYNSKIKVMHYSQRLSYKNPKITFSHIQGLIYYFKKYKYLFNRNKIYKHIKKRQSAFLLPH